MTKQFNTILPGLFCLWHPFNVMLTTKPKLVCLLWVEKYMTLVHGS